MKRSLLRPHKPHLLKITPAVQDSFILKGDEIAWNNPWHFHPEIELLYCQEGKGTNFAGHFVGAIEEGEILLFGKNLPHTRQRDKDYYLSNPAEVPKTIVVQFREDFLGPHFFSLKEFLPIQTMFKKAERGLKFSGAWHDAVRRRLTALHGKSGALRVLELIAILDLLARSADFEFLNAQSYLNEVNERDTAKINKVYAYTAAHFQEPISLAEVSALTNLTPAAFCRYFKTRTRKSYFQYLCEVRITHACGLLMQMGLDISEVGFASGFNNLSNFHRQFKKVMKLTPSEYRQLSVGKVASGFDWN